jgi:dihydroorotase
MSLKNYEMLKIADMHLHLRHDNPVMMERVIRYTSAVCEYAVVMPNTTPPTITAEDIVLGRLNINKAAKNPLFKPLMMMKMESNCHPDLIREAKVLRAVGAKVYPSAVTTNSERGLDQITLNHPTKNLLECWEEQQSNGMISSWHGEMPNSSALTAEKDFLPFIIKLAQNFPKLKIVMEHLTTAEAVEAIKSSKTNPNKNIAATITYHHLRLTLDDVLDRGLKPHHYCKPIPKTNADREALRNAAFSGNPNFFLGSDSAPHYKNMKEAETGMPGVYTAPVLAQGLVDFFDSCSELQKLKNFASVFGPQFYGLEPVKEKISLKNEKWTVPTDFGGIVSLHSGETLNWSL